MIRRIVSWLVALTLCFSLFPIGAMAADDISSTGMTIADASDALSKAGNYTAGGGTVDVIYDSNTQTVTFTMNGAALTGGFNVTGVNAQLNLTGENSISSISVKSGNLTICGEGKLTAESSGCTIYCSGDIVVDESTVIVNSRDHNGFHAEGNITFQNGAAISGETAVPMIYADKDVQIDGSTVNVCSTGSNGTWINGSLTIHNESKVTANGYYSGIGAIGVTIKNSEVEASSDADAGIWTRDSVLTIQSGSKVTADGYNNGIVANGVTVENSEVKVSGENGHGILSLRGDVIITDGTVTITSNAAYNSIGIGFIKSGVYHEYYLVTLEAQNDTEKNSFLVKKGENF